MGWKQSYSYALGGYMQIDHVFDSSITPGAGNPAGDPIKAAAGTYTYTISEEKGSDAGHDYDSDAYTVTVVVTDPGGESPLEVASITLRSSNPADKPEVDGIIFTNYYNPTPASLDATATQSVMGHMVLKVFRIHRIVVVGVIADNDIGACDRVFDVTNTGYVFVRVDRVRVWPNGSQWRFSKPQEYRDTLQHMARCLHICSSFFI